MNIAILGPQGSGKGTQAALLSEKMGLTHIETGKLLREIACLNNSFSKKIKKTMLEGNLVSDDILKKVLISVLESANDEGIVFDGTPRNLVQYTLLKNILAARKMKFDKIIMIDISEKETIKRLTSRRTCKECGKIYNLITNPPPTNNVCECGGVLYQRDDDKPEAIIKRLENYKKETIPVLEAAQKDQILIELDGERPIEEIYKDIIAQLNLQEIHS